jgi:hypothetical protein
VFEKNGKEEEDTEEGKEMKRRKGGVKATETE